MVAGRLAPVPVDVLSASIGSEITSPWRVVTQEMVDKFADATDDHQFIHVDPQRAAAETPYGGTIAHGFLSLSLLSAMAFETVPPIEGTTLSINQGLDQVRFQAPVRTGARVRTRFKLAKVRVRPSGWVEITHDITIDIEESRKPALTAIWLTLAKLEPRDDTHG
ncbi:MAG: MaoC family dehydratase [Rhizobiaceae bacterium]|nr:MaoC family dehydratase [Rhizobiaceae bacterium]